MNKNVYVRKTTTWQGKRYEVRGKTEPEAIEKLAVLKEQLRRGEITTKENMTVNEWFKEWMEIFKKPAGLTEKSLSMYLQKYEGYIKPAIGTMKLRDVTDVHLQRILNNQAGKSFSHVSKIRLVMKAMFSRAHASRMLLWDPSAYLTLPATSKGTRRSLTDEERSHVLAVAEDHRAGLWILTLLYAGLRPGEAAALQWKDIDFKENEIHIYKAVESGSMSIKGPKTSAGVRDIPMHPELRKRFLAIQKNPLDPVFKTSQGNRLDFKAIRRLWTGFIRDLDIHMGAKLYRNRIVEHRVSPDLTPYCLRHTFCTDLQKAGVPINVAKELMGHADIQTTANIYTHKDAKILHKNMGLMWENTWDFSEKNPQSL